MYEKNTRFKIYLTENMNNMMIELLITQQMLKDDKIDKEDKILLENHKQELMKEFTQEFKNNNKKEIKQYNELMNK